MKRNILKKKKRHSRDAGSDPVGSGSAPPIQSNVGLLITQLMAGLEIRQVKIMERQVDHETSGHEREQNGANKSLDHSPERTHLGICGSKVEDLEGESWFERC